MSSRSHIDHAVVKNQKVFPVFARKLSNPEQKNYVDACKRLGTWLGDAKAYYSAARPKVRACSCMVQRARCMHASSAYLCRGLRSFATLYPSDSPLLTPAPCRLWNSSGLRRLH
ncbi:hypothetical protein FA95DRAFT_1355177 [Auriscalpium vulgare]|uniref:Uncharacterized protein n=1 Tax=Auriscalpium vulgare TaxID=40419 RepID=A0ACB8RRP7_9AGAM|nr:hypothetical protein FA95DRAFT_1355177 [Auriscalpium vulgare]